MEELVFNTEIGAEYIAIGTLDNTTVSQSNNLFYNGEPLEENADLNFYDIYGISLAQDSNLQVNGLSNTSSELIQGFEITVVEDTNGNNLLDFEEDELIDFSDTVSSATSQELMNINLTAGNYFLLVSPVENSEAIENSEEDLDDFAFNLDYSFDLNSTTLTENIPVDNQNINDSDTNLEVVEDNFVFMSNYQGGDGQDSYEFEIAQAGTYDVDLTDLEANLDLSIGDGAGNTLYSSAESGNQAEYIAAEFEAGTYVAYITGEENAETSYSLSITRTSSENGSGEEEPIINEGDTVYRFLETNAQTQFYTTSEVERDTVIADLSNYEYEGPSFVGAPDPETTDITGITPVHRFLNLNTGVHLYTADPIEQEAVAELPNYEYEGVSYYGYETQQEGSVPLYRFYNQNLGAHFYTPSLEERDVFLDSPDYQAEGLEGIAYYVDPV